MYTISCMGGGEGMLKEMVTRAKIGVYRIRYSDMGVTSIDLIPNVLNKIAHRQENDQLAKCNYIKVCIFYSSFFF